MYQYTIELYKNHSENDDVQKVITDKHTVNAEVRHPIDLLQPTIPVVGLNVNDYNYCYIRETMRYYYIMNTVMGPNGVFTLSLKVDVLMSYINDIKASSGLITKQKDYNPYYGDYDVEARTLLQRYEFEDRIDHTGQFVLVALRH